MNNLIPIGSVVMVQGIESKILIIGHFPKDQNTESIKDYLGVGYLRGIIREAECCTFNHEDITEVFFETPLDEEDEQYHKVLAVLKEDIKRS